MKPKKDKFPELMAWFDFMNEQFEKIEKANQKSKTIKKELSTGVTTSFKDKGGRINVELKDYDTYFDQPTLESELSNNTQLLLAQNFNDIKL